MTSEEYVKLYDKFIAGRITQEEKERLFGYQDKFELKEDTKFPIPDEDEVQKRVFHNITAGISGNQLKVKQIQIWRYAAAAVLLFSITTGIIFFNSGRDKGVQLVNNPVTKTASNKAVLTLANGAVIKLEQANNGVLSSSGKTLIKKLKDGQLVYDQKDVTGTSAALAMNSLAIPNGGQYQITLGDGTKIWLNSGTTLSYPTNFKGNERVVELTGEAYFEVAKNKKMPFRVKANGTEVEVLGTHFNVNAYGHDPVKATLLEGLVRFSNGGANVKLSPGQQGVSEGNTSPIQINEARLADVVAWKNGYFVFRDDNIADIMKQISRWYDTDVAYQGKVTNKTFGGIYSKGKDLSELLKALELTGLVHFKVEGRRVTVMP